MNRSFFNRMDAQDCNAGLAGLFAQKNWENLDAEQRLGVLRRLEEQTARSQGRTPLDVRIMPEKTASGGVLGYYDHSCRTMFLHPRYFRSGGLNLGDFGAAAAVRTVLHEGRHGFQWTSVSEGSDRVSRETLLEWAVNQCCYFSGSSRDDRTMALYFFQPVEIDARRFARETASALLERIEAQTGAAEEAFRRSMEVDRRSEEIVRDIVRRGLTLQIIESAERRARSAFARYNPRVDVSGVQIFHEARQLLNAGSVSPFTKGFNLPPRYGVAACGAVADISLSWPESSGGFTGGLPGCIALPGML